MPPASLQRIGTRILAGAAIGLMIAGALAAPAAAEDPSGTVENQAESHKRYDYNGDGYNDLVYVRKSNGKLYFRAGDGSGNYGSAQALFSGFNKMDVVMAGDLTSDGFSDLVVRDNQSSVLYTYPGDGAGGFGARITAGTHYAGPFTVLDYDGDSIPDLVGARGDGAIYYADGRGDGTFGSSLLIDERRDYIDMVVAPGDVDRDGKGDFLLRSGSTQRYALYLSGSKVWVTFDPWLADPTKSRRYSQVVSVGDVDGNGTLDLLTVDSRTGALYRQSLTATGAVHGFTTVQDSGWNAYRLPSVVDDNTYDYDMDGDMDVVTRRPSTNASYVYLGSGRGTVDERVTWDESFGDLSKWDNAGDFTGDGRPDLIGRVAATGELYVYPGNGTGGVDRDARVKIGTGWNAMDTIVTGYDYNYDGKTDIVAREKGGGTLWLYPGTGNGKVGARTALDAVAVADLDRITSGGDFNHDGFPDLLAQNKSDGCLVILFGQAGADYFKEGADVSCDWAGMDAMTDIGDADSDGHNDFVARRISDGRLFLYRGDGRGGFEAPTQFSTNWKGMRIA